MRSLTTQESHGASATASNTASGVQALFNNTTGHANTASGFKALFSNTTGKPTPPAESGAL